MGDLFDKLANYGNSGIYPFHMPGHKRQKMADFNPYKIDITEIEGFDNLHHAEGVLLEAQKRAEKLYGSEESHFLVNGSTAGILSAVSACAKKTILIARNCHKAVYSAALIRNLDVYYVYPEIQKEYMINGGINPAAVEQSLKEHPEIEAVVITSPTYDGVVSDIKKIAEITHTHGKPLIVDEAHGAHFGFSKYFPENSVHLGADIVIHSLHKTLPSYTQTALIHINGNLVDRQKVRLFLQMYQTSSPSYILMAGMDECIRYVEEQGSGAFEKFAGRLDRIYRRSKEFRSIHLIDESIVGKNSIYDFDRSKLIFSVKKCGIAGNELQKMLLRTYNIEMEMAAGNYALALTSLCDTDEGFHRLFYAVKGIDEQISRFQTQENGKENTWIEDAVTRNEVACTMNEALETPKKSVLLQESEGCISGEFLYPYPPGIPVLVPGEKIDAALLKKLEEYRKKGFQFQGLKDYSGEKIEVLSS